MALAVQSADGPGTTGFEDVYLVHDSVPQLDLQEIDLQTHFLGKKITNPLLINALTGGPEQAKNINRSLAITASKCGLAMAVGSMTIAMEDTAMVNSFSVVREMNPDGVIIANLGANSSPRHAREAVKMIAADGLQLHFNVPQELAMAEGDRNFRGIIDNVSRIVEACPVPVIAKEVGFGFSREAVLKLLAAGVNIFDNGGQGGTNFLLIEDKRQGVFEHQLNDWGIPTAISLAEIISLQKPIQVVASGGIRSALDIAKAIAIGADMVGITGWFLKILLTKGQDELERSIEGLIYQLKSVLLMCGAQDCAALKTKPVLMLGKTAEWLRIRDIDPAIWCKR